MERFEGDGAKPNFDATKRNFRSQFRLANVFVTRGGILAKVEYLELGVLEYWSSRVLQCTVYSVQCT